MKKENNTPPQPDLEELLMEAENLGIRNEVLELTYEIFKTTNNLTYYEIVEMAFNQIKNNQI